MLTIQRFVHIILNFKTRFSLVLSKTVKHEVDLASVSMEVIDLYEAARGKHIVDQDVLYVM